jgi:hypothetical protein
VRLYGLRCSVCRPCCLSVIRFLRHRHAKLACWAFSLLQLPTARNWSVPYATPFMTAWSTCSDDSIW